MPTLRLLSLLILAPVLLLTCASAEQEKEPEYPPIQSLDDVTDITDKVLAWDVPVGTIEEFSIFDTIPPLPNPDPICFAPEGLDSFADGRKIPRQFGDRDVSPTSTEITPVPAVRYISPAHNMFWKVPRESKPTVSSPRDDLEWYGLTFTTDQMFNSYRDYARQNGLGRLLPRVCIKPGYYIFVTGDHTLFGILGVKSIHQLTITDTGEVTSVVARMAPGTEYMTSSSYNPTLDTAGSVILLTADDALLVFRSEQAPLRVPFSFRPKFDSSIWNPAPFYNARNFISSRFEANAPLLIIVERNFGVPRQTPLPQMVDPRTGGKSTESRRFYHDHSIVPDIKRSRMVILSTLNGDVLLDLDDHFRVWALDESTFVLPAIVKDKRWHLAVLSPQGRQNLIPYACILAKDSLIISQSMYYSLFASASAVVKLDAITRTIRRCILPYRHDTQMFHSPRWFSIFTSEPFLHNQVAYRWVINLDCENFAIEDSFLIEDIFIKTGVPCCIVKYDSNKYLVYSGDSYYRFTIKSKKDI